MGDTPIEDKEFLVGLPLTEIIETFLICSVNIAKVVEKYDDINKFQRCHEKIC